MKSETLALADGATEATPARIEMARKTGIRREQQTAGEPDAVTSRDSGADWLRRAEDRLRHRDAARQSAILNALPAHIALLDAGGIIISVNEAWRQFAGANALLGPDFGIGIDYLDICDRARGDGAPEARRAAAGIRAVLEGAANRFALEYPCHSPSEQRWFLMTATPLADARPHGAVVMHLDVTERMLAAQELRESDRRFSDLMRNVQLVSLMIDREARITYCNEYLLRLTGWRYEEVAGRNWFDLFIPPELTDLKGAFFSALLADQPETWHHENEIVTRAGERRLIRWNNSTLRSGTGDVIGIAGIGEDITEQKRTETKIKRLNRVYAVLSRIDALIVRARDRDEIYREACRIAVEEGGFLMSLMAIVDRSANRIVPVASAGKDPELQTDIKGILSSTESAPTTMVARAIREKKAVVSNQSQNDPQVLFSKKYAEAGVRSIAVLPLIVSDEAAGVIALYAEEPGFFDAEELKLLTELAGDIAFALEHIVKEEKIARMSRIHAVASGINALIVRVRDRHELFNGACRIAVDQGQFPVAWIGALDPATQDVSAVASAGEGAAALTRAKSSARDDSARGQGSVGRAIRQRRPAINNDIAASRVTGPRRREILRRGFRSLIALPLFEAGTVMGTLSMYSMEANAFDEEEIRMLTALAGDISFALDNISRQRKLDKLSRIGAISSGINAATIRIHDREALLRETCRIAVDQGKFELVWTARLDQEKQRIEPVAWAGFSSGTASELAWPDIGAPGATLAEVIRTRKVAARNDIDREAPAGPLRREALKRGCRSTACVPFMVDDRVVAAMILYAAGRGFFDEEELKLLDEVAMDVSLALQSIARQEKLNYFAYYDVLTGLANRGLFLERLAQHLRIAASSGQKLAVALIDLERFKNINDSLGRPAGDALLRQLAEWLTRNMGDASLVARVDADRFAAVLLNVRDPGDLGRFAERSLQALLNHPFHLDDTVLRVTVKMGIALFPDDGTDAETLLKHAEAALKKAKRTGDPYLCYTQEMTAAMTGKLALENQLRRAMDNEEFVLHYQPQVNLASGKLTGAEALIRWNDPRTGLVPPGEFIPTLEETGLINDVGRWALKQAIASYLRWRAAGLNAVRIAVNVSPLQLRNRGFVDEIRQAIGIDAHAASGLELEITESLIMADVKHSIGMLEEIRAMGVTIAVDDFGTGFSSLSYLARLPVHTLKIDRSFVIDMTAGSDGLALVSTIINLAHSLKLKVVAEGVETEEQSRLLRLLSCDEMQGYLFSKPVPVEVFEEQFLVPLPAG